MDLSCGVDEEEDEEKGGGPIAAAAAMIRVQLRGHRATDRTAS